MLKEGVKFSNWKLDCSIIDMPFHGVQYTWTNNIVGDQTIFEQLDRAHCKDTWRLTFPNVVVVNFPIFISDHGPISVDCNPTQENKEAL